MGHPSAYLRHVWLERAAALLADTARTVSEIVYGVGFKSIPTSAPTSASAMAARHQPISHKRLPPHKHLHEMSKNTMTDRNIATKGFRISHMALITQASSEELSIEIINGWFA